MCNTNKRLQNKSMWTEMKCLSACRFFMIDYWKLSREVMDSLFLDAFLNHELCGVCVILGGGNHWQCKMASRKSCGLWEVDVAPWAASTMNPG